MAYKKKVCGPDPAIPCSTSSSRVLLALPLPLHLSPPVSQGEGCRLKSINFATDETADERGSRAHTGHRESSSPRGHKLSPDALITLPVGHATGAKGEAFVASLEGGVCDQNDTHVLCSPHHPCSIGVGQTVAVLFPEDATTAGFGPDADEGEHRRRSSLTTELAGRGAGR